MKKTKVVVISAALLLLLITGVIFTCVIIAHNKEEQRINTIISNISNLSASFDEADTTNDKITIYNKLNSEYGAYISEKDYSETVKDEYEKSLAKTKKSIISDYESIIEANSISDLEKTSDESVQKSLENLLDFKKSIKSNTDAIKEIDDFNSEIDLIISDMRKHFTSNYDDTINKNTIENVEKISDKSKFEKAIKNLDELKDSLNKNADIIIDDETVLKEYNKVIDDLIDSYENRIEEIKKAEEEAKKQEEAQNNYSYDNSYNDYNSDNSYSGGSNSSSSSSSSNNNSSSSSNSTGNSNGYLPNHGGLLRWYRDDETGITSYFYNDGYAITSEGYEFNWKDLL